MKTLFNTFKNNLNNMENYKYLQILSPKVDVILEEDSFYNLTGLNIV